MHFKGSTQIVTKTRDTIINLICVVIRDSINKLHQKNNNAILFYAEMPNQGLGALRFLFSKRAMS